MRIFKDMKIATRISLLVCLTLLPVSLVIEIGLRRIDLITEELKVIVEEDIALLRSVNKLTFHGLEQKIHLDRALQFAKRMAQDETAKDKFEMEKKNFVKHGRTITGEIDKMRGFTEQMYERYETAHKRKNRALQVDYELRSVSKERADYQFLAVRVFNLLSQGKFAEAEPIVQKIIEEGVEEEEHLTLDTPFQSLASGINGFARDSIVRAEENKQAAVVGMVVTSALVLFLSLILALFVSRGITKPLRTVTDTANRIADGDRDVEIEVTSKNELGILADSFNKMTEELQRKTDNFNVVNQQFGSNNQQLEAGQQQPRAANQQLQANEQQLIASNQQLQAEIAERKQMEAKLAQKRNLLRALVDTLPEQIFAKDINGTFIFNNISCARNLGTDSPKDVVGKTDFDFLPRERAEQHHAKEQQIMQTGQPLLNHEVCFHNEADDTTKWFSTTKVPWRDDDGNVIGIVGMSSDITERKKVEDALESEKYKVQSYLDAAEVTILVLDTDQKVQLINRNGCELLGYNKKEIVGKDWCENFVPEQNRDEVRLILSKLLSEKIETPHYYENSVLTEGKQARLVAWRNTILHHNKKGAIALISSGENITDRRLAEQNLKTAYKELEETNRELKEMQSQLVQNEKLASIGQLAAGVAHEMNTPVGFVASNFQTLESYVTKFKSLIDMYSDIIVQIDTSEKGELKKKIDAIRESWHDMKMDFILKDIKQVFKESKEGLNRVTSIIQNLRDFSRIDKAENFEEYHLNDGINATLIVARNEIKYDADVKTDFGDLPSVPCHPGQINQVLLNMLLNAAQAIKIQEREGNGTITIKTYVEGNNVVVEIADDGPGIDPEKISKIFDPFFTTKPAGKGTGLGLSVSHDIIVNKHKGEILVDSTVGEGTTFTIKLPYKTTIKESEKELEYSGAKNSTVC